MEKINLSMTVGKWLSLHIRKGAMGWKEFRVAVFGGFDDFTVRLLCTSTESEMLQVSDLGKEVLTAYIDALKEAGLRFGMTNGELDAYQREYEAGHMTKPVTEPVPKPDAINWEQRRWELAVRIFMEEPYNPIEQTTIASLNKADIFIRQYRQILNTEK